MKPIIVTNEPMNKKIDKKLDDLKALCADSCEVSSIAESEWKHEFQDILMSGGARVLKDIIKRSCFVDAKTDGTVEVSMGPLNATFTREQLIDMLNKSTEERQMVSEDIQWEDPKYTWI